MRNIPATYHRFTKATAILLLLAFLIPSGLHSKQIVDFCKMETASSASPVAMAADHSCCESESTEKQTENKNHQHHNCEWGLICACSIGQSQIGDKVWIPVSKEAEVTLTKTGELTPYFTSGESILSGQQIRIGEYSPPLWLLYDTFLN